MASVGCSYIRQLCVVLLFCHYVAARALTSDTNACDEIDHFPCEEDVAVCIGAALWCDGVQHCPSGTDEQNCDQPKPAALQAFPNAVVATSASSNTHNPTSATPTTKKQKTKDPDPTDPVMTQDEIYLWLPLIAVVVFTGIMVILILIGRNRDRSNNQGYTDQIADAAEENSNPGYEESDTGRPSTPPPSYSVIERQTSYASYISQSSSQLSVPPDYDEAVELPDVQNGRPARARMNSAPNVRRSRSNRAGPGHRIHINRPSARLFSRSVSATESTSPQVLNFRSLTSTAEAGEVESAQNPALPRNQSDPAANDRGRIGSDDSSVFVDEAVVEPGASIHMDTFQPPAPSSPERVSSEPDSPSATSENAAENAAEGEVENETETENREGTCATATPPARSPSENGSHGSGTSHSSSDTPEGANASAFALLGSGEQPGRSSGGPNAVSFYFDEEEEER